MGSSFSSHAHAHIGVDRHDLADVLADAHDVPLDDEYADTVLMNEVLEHLERPADSIREAYRLLKPGGYLILDTPFIWPIHEAPRDFFRFTPFGLRYLLESAGFEVVELIPLTGAWVTLSLLASYALEDYKRGLLRPLITLAQRALQRLALTTELVSFQSRFTTVNVVVARKPPA